MFSKKLANVAAAALAVFSLSSCFQDKAPTQLDLGLGKGLNGCLASFDATIRNYFAGRASEQEITNLFDCSTESFDLFMKHTRGEKTGKYLPGELRGFFTKYFLGDKRISDDLLKEAMILKQAILGGSDEELSFDELKITIDLLKMVKKNALRMLPYMPITSEHFNDLSGTELQNALKSIDLTGESLGKFLTRASRPYYLQNLSTLLLEMQQLMESGDEGRGARILRDNIEVFGSVKGILFGGPAESILPTDWSKIATIGTRWYSMLLRINNLNARKYENWRDKTGSKESWFHSEALRDLAKFGEAAYGLFLESLNQHPEKTIRTKEDLNHLIDALTEPSRDNWNQFNREEAWRPFDREMSGYVKSSIVYAVQKVLGGYETNPTGRDAKGLTVPLFDRIWNEFAFWYSQQKYLEKTFLKLGGQNAFNIPGYTREQILSVPDEHVIPTQLFESQLIQPDTIQAGVSEMKDLIRRFRPLFAGKDNKIYFPDRADDPLGSLYSYSNLATMNWIRSLSRIVVQGYVKSKDTERARSYGGLTEDELNSAYWDFRSLGVKVGVFDTGNTTAGVKRFREANLFTSLANGDNVLSLDEATELFSYLLSAGTLSGQLHLDISRACPVGPKDPSGSYEIQSACYKKRFAERLQTREWAQMPGMIRYFQKLTQPQKDDFMQTLESAAKGVGSDSQMINHFETEIMVMVPHYIEAVYSRFDINFSGKLELNEALTAFPIFRQILLDYQAVKDAGLTEDDDLQAIFTFLLKEGRAPTTTEFILWRYVQSWEGKINADRGILLKIFASLAAS